MSTALAHFDALTRLGLKIIPLRENSKVPLCKGWNENWDREKLRYKLQQMPDSNLGILLGDIVDVEGDSEFANRMILDMIGDYPHPTYQSTKSLHHLFLNPDKNLSHFRYEEIEFRGHGHQSVIPPSQHQGICYRWLKTFRFPVPPMPDKLKLFYYERRHKYQKLLKPGHIQVWCSECREKCFLHEKRFQLENKAFQILECRWQCQNCREVDLRQACRMIRGGAPNKIVKVNALQSF